MIVETNLSKNQINTTIQDLNTLKRILLFVYQTNSLETACIHMLYIAKLCEKIVVNPEFVLWAASIRKFKGDKTFINVVHFYAELNCFYLKYQFYLTYSDSPSTFQVYWKAEISKMLIQVSNLLVSLEKNY